MDFERVEKNEDSKVVLMKSLLRDVKLNQDMFLNNKLDYLLNQFGNRKCKSMPNLISDEPMEDDPRTLISWPLSPNQIEHFKDQEFHFTKNDAFGT